ncbi:transposase [Streptomyces sp. NPDC046182]|uniref:transposase n=1 Tax=Streptomyces sp. NPDC046182 TaxID=3154601 RepID=UPI0033DDBEC5
MDSGPRSLARRTVLRQRGHGPVDRLPHGRAPRGRRLPRTSMGRPRLYDRTMLNGIVWKFRAGVAWREVPERYGPWASLHTRFRRRAADCTFDRKLQTALARADAAGDIDWLASVDS